MSNQQDSPKHPSDMSDAEFKQAMIDKLWRGNPPPATAGVAMGMSDKEFAAALKNKSWRKK